MKIVIDVDRLLQEERITSDVGSAVRTVRLSVRTADPTLLSDNEPLNDVREEQLLQGPFADAMLHLEQIGIFRRMGGSPVPAENYVFADIQVGSLCTVR